MTPATPDDPPNAPARLLVRVDDAGTSHASNIGCLQACTDGIARSVEVMMPGGWITQAADLFNAHPEIDIGIHLTLTSEWDAVKWRPLTQASSLVDDTGAFLPLLHPRPGRTAPSLQQVDWSLQEVADELRAQIVLGTTMFRHATHVSAHMIAHLAEFDARLGPLVAGLCREFGLIDDPFGHGLPRFVPYPALPRDAAFRAASMVDALKTMPGGTQVFIDHPAIATPEAAAMGHAGYEDVLQDRVACLDALTDPAVKACLAARGIPLISYGDLVRAH